MNVYQMLEAQSKTIKMLQEERLKTVMEANRLMLRYQGALDKATEAITALTAILEQHKARIKELECDSLDKSWDSTKATHKKGEGQEQ